MVRTVRWKCLRRFAAVPKPQRWAISSIEASVDSSAARAASTRWASSQRRTGTPVSALKAAGERALGDVGVGGERADRERLVQALERPRAGRGQRPAGAVGQGLLDVLGLAALAVRRDDDPARDRGGQRGAVVAAQDVQAEVEAGGDARAGQHLALVDVEHAGLDVDARVAGGEVGGIAPVGGGAVAVEHAGGGQRERAGADRDHPRAALVGGAQRVQHRLVRHPQVRREARGRAPCRRARAPPGPAWATTSNPALVRTGPAAAAADENAYGVWR